MIPYRFRRRAFLTALSGGVGLKIMLRNLESSAQGMRSPGRLFVTHWPVGIVAGQNDALWKPTSGSVGGSPALAPFAAAGLGPDMTVIRGLSTAHLNLVGGGGHEQGTVSLMTGRVAGGTRTNCCEGDDAYAAPGGSVDQILLANVPALQRPGPGLGYANSIADSRTDFAEVSTQCLSYSTEVKDVMRYNNASVGTEAVPLLPFLSPLQQYMNLFDNLMPGTTGTGGSAGGAGGQGGAGGGGARPVADAILKKLVGRRSVLDFSLEELNRLRTMAPADARNKLSIHADAVMNAESTVRYQIENNFPPATGMGGNMGTTGTGGTSGAAGTRGGGGVCLECGSKPAPPAAADQGVADPNQCPPPPATKPANCCDLLNPVPANCRGSGNDYADPTNGATDDADIHQRAGKAHLEVLKAAFICDLIRVGTYQWSPGSNHVGFALYPGTTRPYQHHPTSHKIGGYETTASATLAGLNPVAQFLYNVQVWYFARHAENLASWKNAVDGCGNNLLDFTCIPFLTEVTTTSHERSNMAAMIIGGRQLGFVHDRYLAEKITINQLWGTIAQAFDYAQTDDVFAAPVPGFWAKP